MLASNAVDVRVHQSQVQQMRDRDQAAAAGHRNGDGSFEDNTVFGKVDRRLIEMARMMKEFD